MRFIGRMVLVALVAVLVPREASAATVVSCADQYLSCINIASQESGWAYRTAKEVECGVDYYACMRRKVIGV